MLQKMRDRSQGIVARVIVYAIVVVMAVFGVGAFSGFLTEDPPEAVVNGDEITLRTIENAVIRQRQRVLQQMGDRADPSLIDEAALRQTTIDGLVDRTLLLQEADALGLAADRGAIEADLVATEAFQVDGRFDPARYRRVLADSGFTPTTYLSAVQEDMLVTQLIQGVAASEFASGSEVDRAAQLVNQRRDAAWLVLPIAPALDAVDLTDADIEAWHREHAVDYVTEERVRIEYIELALGDFVDAAAISDADIEAAWEAERQAFNGAEQRRAEHILLEIGADDEADVLAKAADLRVQIAAGGDFAALARAHSSDPGSRDKGGDLGFAGKDVYVPEFEQALWALEPGQVSEPVRTEFGVHIIRLADVRRTEMLPLEQEAGRLRDVLARDAARSAYESAVGELEQLAFESFDLAGPAEALRLEVRRSEPFTRAGGEGIAAAPRVVSAAFSPEVLEQNLNSEPLAVDDERTVVIRLAEHQPARPQALDEVREQVSRALRLERATEGLRQQGQALLARLRNGDPVAAIAADTGIDWQRHDGLVRNAPDIEPTLVRAVFTMGRPGPDSRVADLVALDGGDLALALVTRVDDGRGDALNTDERTQLRRSVAQQNVLRASDLLRRELLAEADIERR